MSHFTDPFENYPSRTKPSSTFQTDQITNATATSAVPNYIEICQRTGFKQLPHWHPMSEIVKDGYGEYIRKKSADQRHPQDYIGGVNNDIQVGPQFPEPSDDFSISSASIAPEDL